MKNKNLLYILTAAGVIVGISIGVIFQPLISGDSIFTEVKKFNYVLNTAYKNYVDEVDSHKLVESAIRGMLEELDVHSVYISEEDMKDVKEDFEGAFEGIGIEFDVIHDTITVVTPLPGGPSEELGIMAGDKIVKIDDENAVGLNRNDVPKKLKGPKGTKVVVDIKREGFDELLKFEIIRDKIPINTVDAKFMIENTDIGFIMINRFASTTHDEMITALRELKKQGMKKLILDLRGNPGGYLSQAFYVADEFLKGGDTIVYTRGRKPEFEDSFMSTYGGEFENIPMIVMINAGSASASEIVSGAIQDLDRGLIVGTTSYGKGLVQRQYEVGDGSAFRITTSKYYTPSGRCIQRPFKDKDKYRHLAGRLDLENGNYIYNSIQKIKEHLEKTNKNNDEINVDSLPIYYTKGGRVVLGGGGITPDIIVKMDSLTNFSIKIRMKNFYNEFINDYVELKEIEKKYKTDFKKFNREFTITQKMADDFKELAIKKEVEWNDEEYEIDKDYLHNEIKRVIARIIWGRNEDLQIFYSQVDNQLKKAIEMFPEVMKLYQLDK
jgi:carboxyl-terminal processing protease